ncbi:MAG: GDP-L-fucose synthase [Mariprofundaceae bacterium]|nr:GDP-L-fucose synthase [Mariprofundaceae bacterium]
MSTMNKKSKIYIAGHRGLVGSALFRHLQAKGYQNIIFRRSQELDLCRQQSVDDFFAEALPDYVFLAAAKVGGIYANSAYPADFIRDNIQIQTNVIDAAYRNKVKKLLFLGSSCIYPKHAAQPMPESCLLTGALESTNEWYAIAKIAGIKMCQAYRKQYGFDAISVMPTNLYGPNDNFDLENSHVLPALIRKFHLAKLALKRDIDGLQQDERNNGRIPDDFIASLGLDRDTNSALMFSLDHPKTPRVMLWGSGSPYREFLHVDDMANASVFLMEGYSQAAIVNVGVGHDITIKDLALLIQRVVGFEGDVVWDSSKPDGTARKLMDVQKINGLGWKSQIDLQEGISRVYASYCS